MRATLQLPALVAASMIGFLTSGADIAPGALTSVFEVVPTGQSGSGNGEIASTSSKRINAGHSAIETVSSQHVFEVMFKGVTHTETSSGYQDHPNTVTRSLFIPSDVYFADTVSGSQLAFGYWNSTSSGSPEWQIRYMPTLSSGNSVKVHLPQTSSSSFVLSGRGFHVIFWTHTVTWTYNQQTMQWDSATTDIYERWNISLDKLMCASMGASIDSRKVYGQPNTEGEIPGDANADPRNANFANWIFKGGLFIGNMPFPNTPDQSRLARMQFKTTSSASSGTLLDQVLTLFYKGKPSVATGDLTVGAFVPASNDSNLSVSESTLTWANKWTITPRASQGTPPDWKQDPITKVTFGTSSAADTFANWGMLPSGATQPWTYSYACLAIDDEPTGTSLDTFKGWRYFASRQFETDDPASSSNKDWAPRFWALVLTGTTTW